MARPVKLNAEWFTHQADLRNDRRVKAIRTATGMAGYGLLHCLLETLTDADNTTIPVDELELELLAGDFGVEASQILSVLEVGKKVGYFAIDEARMLTCPDLNKWLEMHFDKRNRSRNPRSSDSLPQPVTETPIPVTETPHSTVHNNTVQDITTTTSSLRSEVAAPQKKIEAAEVAEPLPESPATELRTPGGAADVGTSNRAAPGPEVPAPAEPPAKLTKQRGGQKLKPEPGSADPADYQMPEWAGTQFVAEFGTWLATRQSRTDCRPLTAKAVQARLKELAGYDEQFCTGLFRQAEQNPHWQGLTFDNTPHKFTQHILAIQKLQQDASRLNQPERGAKPTEAASYGARALSAQLRAIREERGAQNGSHVHTGAAAGTHAGLGSPVPPGIGASQGG